MKKDFFASDLIMLSISPISVQAINYPLALIIIEETCPLRKVHQKEPCDHADKHGNSTLNNKDPPPTPNFFCFDAHQCISKYSLPLAKMPVKNVLKTQRQGNWI